MKVLQINSVCGSGSTGRIATDIHALLTQQGYDSYIAYGRNEPSNCEQAIRIGNKIDIYQHVAKTRLLDGHGFGSKKATTNFIEKIKALNPDVIHLHNLHGYYLNIEILFKYLKEINKPIVWTLHDCWPFTGHCAYFEFAGCECWKIDGEHHCIQRSSYPSSWLVNNSKKNFERKREAFTGIKNLTIVTPSKWLANLVKESFLKEYQIKIINNGINIETFKPIKSAFREKNKIEDKFIILGVANIWDKRKGYDYFLELSKRLDEDQKIVMVGLNEKQIRKLPSNIIGITRTNSVHELAEIYSSADVFLNPTLEDNFPTTNLEALACGIPVITFETGGSPEPIDRTSGIVTKNKTTEDILQSISQLKINPLSQEACREKGVIFNDKRMLQQYSFLYDKII